MKKVVALLLAAVLLCTCAVTVCAEKARYETAGDWYQECNKNLPDYICGVWSTDGGTSNLTLGIQNNAAGEAGKMEMLELIEDDSTLTFVYQVYSWNYLYQVFQEMHVVFEQKLGLVMLGIDDMENCVIMRILEEKQNSPDTQNMIREVTEKYGDAVKIEFVDKGYSLYPEEGETEPTESTTPVEPYPPIEQNPPTGELLPILPILLIAAAIVLINRFSIKNKAVTEKE